MGARDKAMVDLKIQALVKDKVVVVPKEIAKAAWRLGLTVEEYLQKERKEKSK